MQLTIATEVDLVCKIGSCIVDAAGCDTEAPAFGKLDFTAFVGPVSDGSAELVDAPVDANNPKNAIAESSKVCSLGAYVKLKLLSLTRSKKSIGSPCDCGILFKNWWVRTIKQRIILLQLKNKKTRAYKMIQIITDILDK